MTVQFEDHNFEGALLCPRCKESYLYQTKVEVFEPTTEDAEEGIYAAIDEDSVHVGKGMEGNPSSRRQGLVISFKCEFCFHFEDVRLGIYQHKGQTYMEWQPRDR